MECDEEGVVTLHYYVPETENTSSKLIFRPIQSYLASRKNVTRDEMDYGKCDSPPPLSL